MRGIFWIVRLCVPCSMRNFFFGRIRNIPCIGVCIHRPTPSSHKKKKGFLSLRTLNTSSPLQNPPASVVAVPSVFCFPDHAGFISAGAKSPFSRCHLLRRCYLSGYQPFDDHDRADQVLLYPSRLLRSRPEGYAERGRVSGLCRC
jgi:hypothetical protein